MNAIVNETRAPGITAAHPTHKLKWLLKRELWEHRGGFIWAPLIAGIVSLFFTLVGGGIGQYAMHRYGGKIMYVDGKEVPLSQVDWNQLLTDASPEDLGKLGEAINLMTLMSSTWPLLVFAFVVFFYLLGSLYEERKDRSVLFWKSMPISDAQTVLSKLLTALVVGPLIALAITWLMMLATGLIASLFIAINGGNPFILYWSHLSPLKLFTATFGWLPVYVAWALPTAGWLMLCSAWAKRMPFLWAIMVPVFAGVAISTVNGIVDGFGGTRGHVVGEWFWQHVVLRVLTGTWPGSHLLGYLGTPHLQRLDRSPDALWGWDGVTTGLHLFASPQLWIGAIAGILMILAAIRLRRWRDEG